MNDTLGQLKDLARDEFGLETAAIDPDATFSSLGIDSLSMMEFIFFVEDRFDIKVEIDQALAVPTLRGLAAVVDRLVAAAVPAAHEAGRDPQLAA